MTMATYHRHGLWVPTSTMYLYCTSKKSCAPNQHLQSNCQKALFFFFLLKKAKNLKAPQLWIDLPIVVRVKNQSHQGESVPAGEHFWALEGVPGYVREAGTGSELEELHP